MKVAYIIDPIQSFNLKKDTTYMMMCAAQKRSWQQFVFELSDLWVENGVAKAKGHQLRLTSNPSQNNWYELSQTDVVELADYDVIFMRKDPPFDMEFVYVTYILELAESAGALVVNRPQTLRNDNEKFAISHYPQFTPNTLITRKFERINKFLQKYHDIIVKPLDGMGGESIFRIQESDPNKNVILETITKYESNYVMAQEYQPEISQGDKRILIVNGAPITYLVARIPQSGDSRGNLARGASTVVRPLSEDELIMANQIGKDLKAKGVLFAGIDVIGNALTEINITSPTMARQIFNDSGIDATEILMDEINKIKGVLR